MSKQSLKVLVTGASGQLGQCIQQAAVDFGYEMYYADRKALDITDAESLRRSLQNFHPDVIINTAAYTHVDLAESKQENAYLINRDGVENLIAFCEEFNVKLIHISTDYVFKGLETKPYSVDANTIPTTVYGASKLAGEQVILQSDIGAYWIIRTSWLYSEFGKNFYKTIQNLAGKLDTLRVVNDQIGSPTRAEEFAFFLLKCLPQLTSSSKGIYHFSNTGSCTWFDFAKAIVEKHNLKSKVIAVTSAEFPTAAVRPAYSVLDASKISDTFGFKIKNWREGLG
ncbi:dTDP-4-dehydrorhamnose reductase [Leeuwenhoekiella sp. NPDC079379]|uniref:dTDP-4-dehydrorhamnose reductase n=1 Tax=Leeuwenhoekiella sp. NPDC079379 TaxID=3364122 RepID=UPI0037C55684